MNRLTLTACLFALLAAGCADRNKAPEHPVLSPVPAKEGRLLTGAPQLPRVEVSYGEGDCAPRFQNGMRGTCINGQACNGFGFKGSDGVVQCACFERAGGCETNMACSLAERKCVPLKQLERMHPPKGR